MRVSFLLPPDRFPPDLPHSPDLDNLLKRFLVARTETIFSEAPGKGSIGTSMDAIKVRVESEGEAGAALEIVEVEQAH